MGKTTLSIRIAENVYREMPQTHGMRHSRIPVTTLVTQIRGLVGAEAELTLWDFAGQPDYHIIHQLFLNDTNAALLLFDSSDPLDKFRGISYWAKVLKTQAPAEALKYLVLARCDEQRVTLAQREINRILGEHDLDGYVQSSAKTGEGVGELVRRLVADIGWDRLPRTTTPRLFQAVREVILELTQLPQPYASTNFNRILLGPRD
ncbi:MAG: hypothetical protein HY675_11355 [Chloroflexi bacterium]|nr:hypothetical protein [Chloroflexota bacterium]